MEKISLKDQVVVVTGAAGTIGSVICKYFAKAGGKVVLADILEPPKMQPLLDGLEGKDHIFVQSYVDDIESCQILAGRLKEKYCSPDLFVNCAGIPNARCGTFTKKPISAANTPALRLNYCGPCTAPAHLKKLNRKQSQRN